MRQVEFSIDREIDFMNKYNLTADEFFLIRLIFLAQDDHEEYLSKFFTHNQLGYQVIDLLKSLQEKGIINKSYEVPEKGTIFDPQEVEFNKRVIDQFYQHSQDLGAELFEAYPAFTTINGKLFSLRNIAKGFKSFDDFCFYYGKSIHFNRQEHQKILELLEFGKDNNCINSGIVDFVVSKQWTVLEMMKDEDFGTFNTNELI